MPPALETRRRIVRSLLMASAAVVLLLGRLLFLAVVRGPHLAAEGQAVRMRTILVGAPRGAIEDAGGHVLAASDTVWSLYAVPAQIRRRRAVARRLAGLLHLPEGRLLGRLSRRQALVWLRRKLSKEEAFAVLRLGIPGVDAVPDALRLYPEGELAAQVLGASGIDGQGLDGVELTYDRYLRGTPGAVEVEMDAANRAIPGARVVYRPPVPGDRVRLTLDLALQKIAERAARRALVATRAVSDFVVMLDVRTGGILALAALPSFDPGRYGQVPAAERRDPVVSDDFPPGSTFKIVTAAAALDQGLVTPTTPFYDPGYVRVDGVRLRCWRPGGHGAVDFAGVVEGSCNVGFVEVGLRLGVERFYRYLGRFHLLGRTGVDLPGEAGSIVPPKADVKPVDLATMAFGQTLALTPIQLVAAVAAIADGGLWHRPHVLAEVLSPAGAVLLRPTVPAERVVSAGTAATLTRLLGGVVARGTGKSARIEGYELAGKTGTAQAVLGGRYVEGKYVSSFVGFGPLPHPRLAVLVGINQPVGPYYGGQIAAPVFKEVMGQALADLGVPPQVPVGEKVMVPDLNRRTVSEAERQLASLGLARRRIGGGSTVASQFPPPGAMLEKGRAVVLFTAAGGTARVPDLVGRPVEEALRLLDAAALLARVRGEGFVVRQSPDPGKEVPAGAIVQVDARPHGAEPGGP